MFLEESLYFWRLLIHAGFRHLISILLKNRFRFSDKVVLITGASGGIGEATARAFDREGAKVVLVSRRKGKLDEIASSLKNAYVIEADLNDPAAAVGMIDETVKKYGRLDILINNAASIIVAHSEEVDAEDLVKAFRTNLVAPVVASQTRSKIFQQARNRTDYQHWISRFHDGDTILFSLCVLKGSFVSLDKDYTGGMGG